MTKKLGLIVGMALAALAFAIPVSAASANWTDLETGEELEGSATVTLTGPAGFQVIGGTTGADATLDITLKLEGPGGNATVTAFKDTNCKGKGAGLNGLSCTGTAEKLPWKAKIISATEVTIEGFQLDTHYYSPLDPEHKAAPVTTSLLKGNIIADFAGGVVGNTSLTPDGVTANGNAATVSGSLTASPFGTWGL